MEIKATIHTKKSDYQSTLKRNNVLVQFPIFSENNDWNKPNHNITTYVTTYFYKI